MLFLHSSLFLFRETFVQSELQFNWRLEISDLTEASICCLMRRKVRKRGRALSQILVKPFLILFLQIWSGLIFFRCFDEKLKTAYGLLDRVLMVSHRRPVCLSVCLSACLFVRLPARMLQRKKDEFVFRTVLWLVGN